MSDPQARHDNDVGAYLLGALPDDETRAFERHLQACDLCRLELSRLRVAVEALPRSVDPVAPPKAIKRSLMREVRRERSPTGKARWIARARASRIWDTRRVAVRISVAFAAVVTLLVGGATGYLIDHSRRGGRPRTLSAQIDGSRLPDARATLVIAGDRSGAVLRLRRLPQPDRGHVYELWVDRAGEMVPAAVFGVAPDGTAAAAITGSLTGVSGVFVTSELAPGALRPTTPPLVRARV